MLKYRLMVALPLLMVTLGAFFLSGWYGAIAFLVFVCAFLVCGLYEFSAIVRKIGLTSNLELLMPLGLTHIALIFLCCWRFENYKLLPFLMNFLFVGLVLAEVFFVLCRRTLSKGSLLDAFLSIAGYVYFCLPVAMVVHLFFYDGIFGSGARYLLLLMLLSIRFGDTGAYFFGLTSNRLMKNGNHKIARIISPKKSFEGVVGSVIFTSLLTLFCWYYFSDYVVIGGVHILQYCGWMGCIVWGIACALLGLLGDLAESVLKRVVDIKDSGNIPGLGGVLDLIDSILIMVPFFYVFVMTLITFCS